METQAIFLGLTLAFLLVFSGAHCAIFTIRNNCPYTIWPATLTGGGPQLSSTGFELASRASSTVKVPPKWSGRMWARSHCSKINGKFTCATADCGSGQVACNGAGGIPPASLVEFTLADNGGRDFYDISLVDGFNLPVSITPHGSSADCQRASCPKDVNQVCPAELAVKGSDGGVIACKSACSAFNQPQYCCTGDFGTPDKCLATNYAKTFKDQCPQAYSYAYDDKTSLFTCAGEANYLIKFCP
ncbi:Thaumatin-like protein 1 [Morella rubra]|uniref:Thaumatin-like protein 1 n=1 Tax=Morella rubra TaxID=262757 RepID=A0A6A1VJM3_9ROSI|nr:Thaumatin-like protein 1 [Morella rubra]